MSVSDEGVIAVKDVDVLEKHVRVELRHEGRGEADAEVQVSPYVIYTFHLEALPLGILRDATGGNFSGWQGTLVGSVLFLISAAVIMLTGYIRDMKRDPFAYAVIHGVANDVFQKTHLSTSVRVRLRTVFSRFGLKANPPAQPRPLSHSDTAITEQIIQNNYKDCKYCFIYFSNDE